MFDINRQTSNFNRTSVPCEKVITKWKQKLSYTFIRSTLEFQTEFKYELDKLVKITVLLWMWVLSS